MEVSTPVEVQGDPEPEKNHQVVETADYGQPPLQEPAIGRGRACDSVCIVHGGRPPKTTRKRKGVDEYVQEYPVDFTSQSMMRDGQLLRILVCRFCFQAIGARSDRIKEHLGSKRHHRLKEELLQAAGKTGIALSQVPGDASTHGSHGLWRPPVAMLKFPGKSLKRSMPGKSRSYLDNSSGGSSNNSSPSLLPAPAHTTSMLNSPGATYGNEKIGVDTSKPLADRYCIRWTEAQSNFNSMFAKFRAEESFMDVKISCESKTISCHKLVLSACSPYFEKLLKADTPENSLPIVVLKGMKYQEVQALVDFMYSGEVYVHGDEIHNLLRAAESLQIKGLSPTTTEDMESGVMDVGMDCREHSSDLNAVQHQPVKRRKRTPRKISKSSGVSQAEPEQQSSVMPRIPIPVFQNGEMEPIVPRLPVSFIAPRSQQQNNSAAMGVDKVDENENKGSQGLIPQDSGKIKEKENQNGTPNEDGPGEQDDTDDESNELVIITDTEDDEDGIRGNTDQEDNNEDMPPRDLGINDSEVSEEQRPDIPLPRNKNFI